MHITVLTLRKELLVYSNYKYKLTINPDLLFGRLCMTRRKMQATGSLFIGRISEVVKTDISQLDEECCYGETW
jgi:hypothetical protein